MVKIDNTTLVMVIGGVILAALVFYFFFWKNDQKSNFDQIAPPKSQPSPSPPVQQASTAGQGPVLILFYGNQCPHCHAIMPAWQEVKKTLAGKLDVREIEGQDPSMGRYVPVQGVPTIRLYPHGVDEHNNFINYSGDRSVASLLSFAATGK